MNLVYQMKVCFIVIEFSYVKNVIHNCFAIPKGTLNLDIEKHSFSHSQSDNDVTMMSSNENEDDIGNIIGEKKK